MTLIPYEGLVRAAVGGGLDDEFRELLSGNSPLNDLPWEQLKTLATFMQGYRLPAGRALFKEGDLGSFLCVVLAGRVEVHKDDGHGHDKVIATLGPGKTLGEMAMIDGERRSATCVATAPTAIAVLTQEEFETLTKRHPVLAVAVLVRVARILSQRLRMSSGQLIEYL